MLPYSLAAVCFVNSPDNLLDSEDIMREVAMHLGVGIPFATAASQNIKLFREGRKFMGNPGILDTFGLEVLTNAFVPCMGGWGLAQDTVPVPQLTSALKIV